MDKKQIKKSFLQTKLFLIFQLQKFLYSFSSFFQ